MNFETLKRINSLEEAVKTLTARVAALEADALARSRTLTLKKPAMTQEQAKEQYEKTFGRG